MRSLIFILGFWVLSGALFAEASLYDSLDLKPTASAEEIISRGEKLLGQYAHRAQRGGDKKIILRIIKTLGELLPVDRRKLYDESKIPEGLRLKDYAELPELDIRLTRLKLQYKQFLDEQTEQEPIGIALDPAEIQVGRPAPTTGPEKLPSLEKMEQSSSSPSEQLSIAGRHGVFRISAKYQHFLKLMRERIFRHETQVKASAGETKIIDIERTPKAAEQILNIELNRMRSLTWQGGVAGASLLALDFLFLQSWISTAVGIGLLSSDIGFKFWTGGAKRRKAYEALDQYLAQEKLKKEFKSKAESGPDDRPHRTQLANELIRFDCWRMILDDLLRARKSDYKTGDQDEAVIYRTTYQDFFPSAFFYEYQATRDPGFARALLFRSLQDIELRSQVIFLMERQPELWLKVAAQLQLSFNEQVSQEFESPQAELQSLQKILMNLQKGFLGRHLRGVKFYSKSCARNLRAFVSITKNLWQRN